MFGINTPELLIIAIVAVLVIGPQRLPEYVEKLKNLIREVRRMAAGARETIKDEAGLDLDEIDWKKLDPRQYDPRRIIRDALMDDDDAPVKPVSAAGPAAAALGTAASESLSLQKSAESTPMWGGPGSTGSADGRVLDRLAAGERAPFDVEAT
ncbi:twin-arginine translocase TatA/TatE family subunit [Paeniglutamicibacter antarcticus]|uniref:Twin-arginine translocase TatA/TatE family subunit n=1 Tax=Arthrobacter terrae TaxID=2935737 RepID=A0A931CT09_9MICC|nr:twin-arginine translocase TatA/TatE family subunit [Arthrobacter terrae]MBG0740371.1 twin-arginine translocase TatA/TatE family subunit [Arthrobacter terrae]